MASTASTNADLAAGAKAGTHHPGAILIAEHQHAGRGRRGRSWEAPPRAGLTLSVLLAPEIPVPAWSWLPLLTGLAVTDALTQFGLGAQLKWPNDVLVGQRKLAGVLAEIVEYSGRPAVVIGLGLNVSQSQAELPIPTATSLRLAGAASLDRDVIVRAVLRALAQRYTAWVSAGADPRKSGIGPAYRERCATIGAQVRVLLPGDRESVGRVSEVDDHGRLVVEEPTGPRALAAGDVIHTLVGSD